MFDLKDTLEGLTLAKVNDSATASGNKMSQSRDEYGRVTATYYDYRSTVGKCTVKCSKMVFNDDGTITLDFDVTASAVTSQSSSNLGTYTATATLNLYLVGKKGTINFYSSTLSTTALNTTLTFPTTARVTVPRDDLGASDDISDTLTIRIYAQMNTSCLSGSNTSGNVILCDSTYRLNCYRLKIKIGNEAKQVVGAWTKIGGQAKAIESVQTKIGSKIIIN